MKALLASLLLVASPSVGLAAPPEAPDPEVAKLHHEIAAAKLDRTLDLSRDQARTLLPILKQASQLRGQIRADMEKRKPAVVKALTAIRDDVQRSGTASDASLKALQDARGGNERQALRLEMRAMAERARGVLTDEQRERLRSFDPRPAAGLQDDDEPGMGPGMGPGPGNGPMGHPMGGGMMGPGHRGAMGRGPQMHGPHGRALVMIALTPEFLQLLEARAR